MATGKENTMSRFRASLIHFLISMAVVGAVIAIVYFIWYPGWYSALIGVGSLLIILTTVHLVLGPTLTLILFKPGKTGLLFDLTVVAIVQTAALLYGINVIYQQRPYYTVFAVDRFEVVRLRDIDQSALHFESLASKPLMEPRLVYAERPVDPEQFRAYANSVMFEGQPDLERRPEFWRPYEDGASVVVAAAGRASYLRTVENGAAEKVDRALMAFDRKPERVGYVPIISHRHDFAMLVDLDTGEPLTAVEVNPWVRDPGKESRSERIATVANAGVHGVERRQVNFNPERLPGEVAAQ